MTRVTERVMAVACLVAATSLSAAAPPGDMSGRLPSMFQGEFGPIQQMAKITTQGWSMVQVEDGRIFLISDNFKYAIEPKNFLDVWNGTSIQSFADLEASRAIRMDRVLGERQEDLGFVDVGPAGKPLVVVWLDGYGKEAPEALANLRALLGEYRFRVLWIPTSKKTGQQNRALVCAPDLAKRYVETGQLDAAELQTHATCDQAQMQRLVANMITARVTGIELLPTFIAPNGMPLEGVRADLGDFLAKNTTTGGD